MRVLCTFKQTNTWLKQKNKNLGLCYPFGSSHDIVGFCDSDFAGDFPDSKSTSGHVFTLGRASISRRSKKQGLVALSSTDSEYIGYLEASREAILLKWLYHEITGTDYTPQWIHTTTGVLFSLLNSQGLMRGPSTLQSSITMFGISSEMASLLCNTFSPQKWLETFSPNRLQGICIRSM